MTAQLPHETRLTSIALSTTSFPIIWCAWHMPAQNNDYHMFYQTDIVSVFQKSFVNPSYLIQASMDKTMTLFLCQCVA